MTEKRWCCKDGLATLSVEECLLRRKEGAMMGPLQRAAPRQDELASARRETSTGRDCHKLVCHHQFREV
jgi:hypothetical protein